jgi:4-diphosphocytidyl-2-C-methyl-D-erythritol kinase
MTRACEFRVRAAAKVNLALRVGPLRPDGYHDLATLMVPLDLVDAVAVRVHLGRSGEVACRVPNRPELDGRGNLAAQAAEAFRRRFGVADRTEIVVEKRIPVTAGLGGGSSDAAAVLRALALAYRIRDRAALAAAALEVGSDVPFFLGPGPAWATGRGEKLVAMSVPTLQLVLVYPRDPALAIRAGDAYRWLDASRAASGDAAGVPRPMRGAFRPALARNDLQGPCFERHPLLETLGARLVSAGATAAIMSGSGPTVFGIFAERAAARRAASRMRENDPEIEIHVARTLRRHPGVVRA